MANQRPSNRPPRRSYSMMDMGDLSPLFPSGSYNTESSMRSTLAFQLPDIQPSDIGARVPRSLPADFHNTVNPENLLKVPALAPQSSSVGPDEDEEQAVAQDSRDQAGHARTPVWNAINAAGSPYRVLKSDADTFAQAAGYHVSDVSFRMNEILSLTDDEVDTSRKLPIDESDDGVYHINHKRRPCIDRHDGASYSVVLDKDDPDDIPPHVAVFFEQKRAKEIQTEREMKVPALERKVRFVLVNGAKLLVERVGDVAAPKGAVQCISPRCQFETTPMLPGRYFLSLRSGLVDWQHDRHFIFCLDCFENMWDGKYNTGQWPPASIEPFSRDQEDGDTEDANGLHRTLRADSVIESLDGPVYIGGCHQRLPSTPPAYTSSPSRHEPFIPEITNSPNSINSDGEWLHPPVRTQSIADYFIPKPRLNGDDLDFGLQQQDAAKVRLWKAVSKEQKLWEEHMKRTRIRRAGGELPLKGKGVPNEDEDEQWDDELMRDGHDGEDADMAVLEEEAGLEKWQCYGNRLGDVLRL